MSESKPKTMAQANEEFAELMEVETRLRIHVAMEADLLVRLFPNDERLKYLRDAVNKYQEAQKATIEYMSNDFRQAVLPFGTDLNKVQTND